MAILTSSTLPLRDWSQRNGDGAYHPIWHRSAPKNVSKADGWGLGSDGWAAWSAHLASRRDPRAIAALFAAKSPLLACEAPLSAAAAGGKLPAALELLEVLDRAERRAGWNFAAGPATLATTWMHEASHRRRATFGLEALAWCRALPALAAQLPADVWWQMFEMLQALAEDPAGAVDGDPLARQWLDAELPITLAYLFPEVKGARQLAAPAATRLAAAIESLVAADGMPAAGNLSIARGLLATWARSRLLLRQRKKSAWDEKLEARYAAFAQQLLRLARRDGSMAFAPASVKDQGRELFGLALVGGARAERTLAQLLIPGLKGSAKGSAPKSVPAAANNEQAGVSVLRGNWSRGRERLFVARHGGQVNIELNSGRDTLLSGAWTCEIRRDGTLLVPEADATWDEVCWNSNEDVDYLELELAVAEGVRVQRQMVLARDDRFLLVADSVLCEQPASIEYRSVLPMVEGVTFDAATESREGYLIGSKARALAFPLALPEWRAERSYGSLEVNTGGLELRAAREGARAMYVPLLLDLDPRRLFRPATWRQLTVAELRKAVSLDTAVGYRVQVGKRQWVIYRSLGERGNRTLLGQNLVSDFLVARFDTEGEIAPLLDIE